MPSKNAALWSFDKNSLTTSIKTILDGDVSSVTEGKQWFQTIVGNNPTEASTLIWDDIHLILSKK